MSDVDVRSMPWLTLAQFVAYWRDHAPPDAGVSEDAPPEIWVLTDESQESAPGEGLSLVGLFDSPLTAVLSLADAMLGPERTALLTWQRSPVHDGYWSVFGRDDEDHERHYVLLRTDVETSSDFDGSALAEAVALSPASDPYLDEEAPS